MIDGTQFLYHTPDPNTYLLGFPSWDWITNKKTGKNYDSICFTKFRGLYVKLKPSMNGGYNLLVNGSFHTFYNCGEHNADQFTFEKLSQAIDSFTKLFSIEPEQCFVHGLEVGVNIKLSFTPLRILKNIVSHRIKEFTPVDERNARKGKLCDFKQYSVKIYDKANTNGGKCDNVLRFEVSVDKMQAIKRFNISTLADLQNPAKVFSLVDLLTNTLKDIVWTDNNINLNRLLPREQKQWLYYSNPNTWPKLDKRARYKALRKWETLLHKYSKPFDLLPIVIDTWKKLFDGIEAETGGPFYQNSDSLEADELETILPLECTVKKSPPIIETDNLITTTFSITENINKTCKSKALKRYCLSCGKDISKQSERAIFCSEKLYGKAGKKCRNQHSNKRRSHKRKINQAMTKNRFLLITYTDQFGVTYTDILHSSELKISKEWLDRIQTIETITTNNNNE